MVGVGVDGGGGNKRGIIFAGMCIEKLWKEKMASRERKMATKRSQLFWFERLN